MKKLLALSLLLIGGITYAQNTIAYSELEVENIEEVRIDGSFCDIYVENGNRNYLKAVIEGRGGKGDYEFDTEIVGSTLLVKVIKRDRGYRGYNINEAKIELTIQDNVELDIDNSSGDIFISDLRSDESRIEASSGDITLKQIKANLTVETSSGDISIDDMVGALDMESTSGDQKIYNTRGDIETQSSSGDITVVSFDGTLELEATSGDIEIRGGLGALDIKTTSGNIEGEGIELIDDAVFRASSGDVEIDFENDIADLSFDLIATSGELRAGGKSGEKKLYIDRGGYRVTGVTSSGDQEYE